MSIEWVNGAIEEIRAWGRSKDVTVDVDEVRLLCDYASDYLSVSELADFAPGTFEQLLLDIYPRKVIAPPESAAETVAAARTLVDFLLDSGEIGTKMAARMRDKIDEIAPQMPAALADTSRFGMAKSIFGAMGADADVLATGTAHASADDFAALPSQRTRPVQAEEGCECPSCSPLPPVRLAPPEEIAQAVREVGLLKDAHHVVVWMLAGDHTPTVRGALRVRDAARITRELGVEAPALAFELAVAIGLAEVSRASLTPGKGFRELPSRDDDEVLDLWAGMVTFLTCGQVTRVTGSPLVDREIHALHDMLYRLRKPMTVPAVGEYLDELWAHEGMKSGDPGELEAALDMLAHCGTLERSRDVVRLTQHGLWGLREAFSRIGLQAPEAPDLGEGDAEGMIVGLASGVGAEQAERDIASWLERRSPAEAARELLTAVRGAEAVPRGVAVTIVDRLDAGAATVVRAFLDDPELRPHAAHWLSSRGLSAPVLTSDEVLWMSVDKLALSMPVADDAPEEFAETLAMVGPPAHVIEEMWRVEHPDVAEVLDLLGRHLPDRNIAKAARKAAFKARSRGIH